MKILFIFFFILVSCSTINNSKVKKVIYVVTMSVQIKKKLMIILKIISIEIYTPF